MNESLREQTGADRIYVLERYGRKIILPARESRNYYAEQHPEINIPKTKHYALSHLAMSEQFVPAYKAHLAAKGMSDDEISKATEMLFESIRYLGHSWHRRLISEERVGLEVPPIRVWLTGDGTKKSFYGSDYGGIIVDTVTSLDDLTLN